MKHVLLIMALCFFSFNASATPIPAEKGQQYYRNCMATPDARLLPGTQDPFCQCTAKYMMQNMTMEDLVGMKKQDRAAMNKMIIGVYSPCLEYPVHDDVYQACAKQGVPSATCQCLASNLGKYTATEAVRLIGGVLDKYPNAFDPLAAIKQTPEFEKQSEAIARQCAQTK